MESAASGNFVCKDNGIATPRPRITIDINAKPNGRSQRVLALHDLRIAPGASNKSPKRFPARAIGAIHEFQFPE
jgi:hypothetical protein